MNKSNLTNIMMMHWMEIASDILLEGQELYLSGGFKNTQRVVLVQSGKPPQDVHELFSDHEEADSRMFVHVDHALRSLKPDIVIVWSVDTDVLCLCPTYQLRYDHDQFYFRTGTGNKKRFTPIPEISANMGTDLALLLPVLHALSGCDSTSAFSGYGKKSFFDVVKKNPELVDGLNEIGNDPTQLSNNAMEAVISLLCFIYGQKDSYKSVNDLRYKLFAKKGLSSQRLPPSSDALHQHMQRVNYQSYIWKNAHVPTLNLPSPYNRGWKAENGTTLPVQMTKTLHPKVF